MLKLAKLSVTAIDDAMFCETDEW